MASDNRTTTSNIFQNKSFFINRKCPRTHELKAKVAVNGGVVLAVEKNADLVIYDHARAGGPPGSVSWTFINDCIKYGRLLDHTGPDYLICPPDDQRLVGTNKPTRATRNFFTPAEDANLKETILEHLRKGNTVGGNSVYQDYAVLYPGHPWQSWRNRWHKNLLPNLSQAEKELVKMVERRARLPLTEEEHINVQLKVTKVPKPPKVKKDEIKKPDRRSRPPRVAFTEDDDLLIAQYVRECRAEAKPLNGTRIWDQFAERYSHHSGESWRSHWRKVVEPKRVGGEETTPTTPESQVRNRKQRRQALVSSHSSPPSPRRPLPEEEAEQGDEEEGDIGKMNSGILQGGDSTGVAKGKAIATTNMASQEQEHSSSQFGPPSQFTLSQFEDAFKVYFREAEPDPPVFEGQELDAWDFYHAPTKNHPDPAMRDWKEIAENMGVDTKRAYILAGYYGEYYQEFFKGFRPVWDAYMEEVEGDEDEDELGIPGPLGSQDQDSDMPDEQLLGEVDIGGESTDLPSSPPVSSTLGKRKLDMVADLDCPPTSTRKRASHNNARDPPLTPVTVKRTFRAINAPPSVTPTCNRRSIAPTTVEPATQDWGFETQAAGSIDELPPSSPRDVNIDPRSSTDEPVTAKKGNKRTLPDFFSRAPTAPPDPTPRSAAGPSRHSAAAEVPVSSNSFRSSLLSQDTGIVAQKSTRKSLPTTSRFFPHQQTLSTTPTSHNPQPSSLPIRAPAPPAPATTTDNAPTPCPAISSGHHPAISAQILPKSSPADDEKDDIDLKIEHFVSLGYTQEVASRAMKAASWESSVAQQALEPLKQGMPLPGDVRGLWTGEDDWRLREAYSVDCDRKPGDMEAAGRQYEARRVRKGLRKKHGRESVRLRRMLWREWGVQL